MRGSVAATTTRPMALRPLALLLILGPLVGGATACVIHTGGGVTTTPISEHRRKLVQVVGETRGPARLVVEYDPRRKPVGPPTLHTFSMQVEEKIASVDGKGAAITARLTEAVGASGEPQLTDQLALALDDLKISYRRNEKGAVRDLKISGLRAPLEPHLARAIVLTLFGAARGANIPDRSIDVQDDWTVDADCELVGLTGHLHTFYTLLDRQGDELRFRGKGKIEAIGAVGAVRRRIDGETFSDETVDLASGALVSAEYELSYKVDDEPFGDLAGVGRTRIRAERGNAAKLKAR